MSSSKAPLLVGVQILENVLRVRSEEERIK